MCLTCLTSCSHVLRGCQFGHLPHCWSWNPLSIFCYNQLSLGERSRTSLKLTASLHLKMDGWNTILSYFGMAFFRGHVSFGECKFWCMLPSIIDFWPKDFLMEMDSHWRMDLKTVMTGFFLRQPNNQNVVSATEILVHSLKLTVRTWKWMVGIRIVSFWDGLVSGANC